MQKEFKGDKARKIAQFATVFHMLQHGRPMLEYESMRELFTFLKMPHMSKKHWGDNSGWLMAEYLYAQVMQKAREVIHGGKFLSISVDEVTTVDNQAWISIHAYVVQDFYRTPILVSVERLTEGATAPKLAQVIVDALFTHGGLTSQHLLSKFISFWGGWRMSFPGKFFWWLMFLVNFAGNDVL